MHNRMTSHHTIDILFVLSLFGVFAVSAIILILFGTNVYRKTVSQMDDNYSARTSIEYITEKIRQSDVQNAIQIKEEQGTDILMLTAEINEIPYATSLYEYNGWLYELFARTDIDLPLDAGQPVMEIKNISFTQLSPNLLSISLCDITGEEATIYVSTHSSAEGNHE